jgi:hypothetical protein
VNIQNVSDTLTRCAEDGCSVGGWWNMPPDPECEQCGRPVCSTHAALLDVDATGRPLNDNQNKAPGDHVEWVCCKCQEAWKRFCIHGHDLAVVGSHKNGRNRRCKACAGDHQAVQRHDPRPEVSR